MNLSASVAKRSWPGMLALLGLVLLAYLPVFHAGFIWDDDDYVTQNLNLRSLEGLRLIWFQLGATPQYYPLVHASFWLEYHLWGLAPLGYHLVNVLLHAAGAVLLWQLLRRLQLPGAWLAAALWAVHPINAESVAWVTERKNVLCALFCFASALVWLRTQDFGTGEAGPVQADPGRAKSKTKSGKSKVGVPNFPLRTFALAFLWFACAMLSKTVACSLPAVLLLLVWWKRGRLVARDVWPLVPFFALGIALGLVTSHMEKSTVGAVGSDWDLSFAQRVLIAGRALWFYVGKILWPADFVFIYPRWTVVAGAGWQWLFPAAFAVLIAALWFGRNRLGRGPLVAVLIFAGVLFPALGFFNTYPMLYSFVADHFQYTAGIALFVLLAAGLDRLTRGSRILLALPPLLVALTWHQTQVYHDLETLWRDTVEKNPGCWMGWNNLGLVRYRQGDARTAEECYRKALALRPGYTEAVNNLAALHIEQGRLGDSQSALEEALKAHPDRTDLMVNYGTMMLQLNRTNEAAAWFEKALKLDPRNAEALNNYGSVLAGRGQFREAVAQYRAALAAKPDDFSCTLNLAKALRGSGDAAAAELEYRRVLAAEPSARAEREYAQFLAETGRVDEAVAHYQQLLRLEPGDADIHYNLACLHQARGQGNAALEEYTAALRYRPDYPEAHNNLGTMLAAAGKLAEALPHLEKAVALNPAYFRAHGNLAYVLAGLGRRDEAIAHLRRALEIQPDFVQARNQLRTLGAE